jgi:hypothetical protein
MHDALRLAASRADGGYHVLYRFGEVNRCPGCGRSQWYVGRRSAECVFCATAIDIITPNSGRFEHG